MKLVYVIQESTKQGKDKKSFFHRCGVVFDENRDGSQNMRLDLFPGVTFQIRDAPERQQEEAEQPPY